MTVTNHVPLSVIHSVLNEILSKYINKDGIVQVYFDTSRPRTDPNVAVNVLTLFYKYGRGHELIVTEKWVLDVLITRAYVQSTRYYPLSECYLFLLTRLFKCAPEVKNRMMPVFIERVHERLGRCDGDPLAISMRLLAAHAVGLSIANNKQIAIDLEELRKLQGLDGSWYSINLCSYGSSDVKIGNKGLTTALAVNAILAYQNEKCF